MSRFLNLPKFVPFGDGINFCLLDDFGYEHSDGKTITAPQKFITDFASIPREFYSVVGPPWGKYGFIAILHDWLYYSQYTSKKYADDILMEGMKIAGVGVLQRDTIYEAVSKAGQSAWDANAKQKALGFLRIAEDFPISIKDMPFTWVGTTGDWKKG